MLPSGTLHPHMLPGYITNCSHFDYTHLERIVDILSMLIPSIHDVPLYHHLPEAAAIEPRICYSIVSSVNGSRMSLN